MNLRTPQPDEANAPAGNNGAPPGESARLAAIKFLYPTGATPLEGYTIKRGVGRGGFGEVYFATSDAGKEVALKLIRRNLDVELRGVRHCLNLKHPNLISVYDIRTDSVGDQWVVMEFVSGESLEDAIERHPDGMPPAEAIRWLRGIGAGVAYLHDHGIVHRDLKPGNVFLDEGGMVMLGDYGLSKFISCSRRSGQTESVGTVHYMAPEIANGRYGREIDTYALGIILYEMLTGHVPFEGESVGEVLMKHLTAEPDLSKLNEPYRDIVRRTLAKDPEVRIGSVQEMLALLPDGQSVGPLYGEKLDGWSGRHAAGDGIGAAHLFPDTSVRGEPTGSSAGSHDPLYHRLARNPWKMTPSRGPDGQNEPLYEWLSTSWSGTVDRWHGWRINPVGKALLLFLMVGLAVVTVPWWGLVAAGLCIVYVFYYVFWSAFVKPADRQVAHQAEELQAKELQPRSEAPTALHGEMPPASANPPTDKPTRHEQAAARRRLRMNWRDKVGEQLAAKPLRTKATELLTSMVLSGIACVFLSLLAVMLVGGNSGAERVPLHLWLSIVSTAGCWVILATNKFCEGRFEDQIPLRMTLLVCGLGVGLLATGLLDVLLIGVPQQRGIGVRYGESVSSELLNLDATEVLTWRGNGAVAPSAVVSMLYFGLLFLGLRWWRLAEYTRRVRLSLVGVGLCICGAWIAHLVCWYPQPAGMAVAGVVAVATQLVSPWLPPRGRKAAAEETLAV